MPQNFSRILISALLLIGASVHAQDLLVAGVSGTAVQTDYTPPSSGDPFPEPGFLDMSVDANTPATINTLGASGNVDLEITAPAGQQINVTPDSSGDFLEISAYYRGSTNAGLSLNGPLTVTFTGLTGNAPGSFDNDTSFGYISGTEYLELVFVVSDVTSSFSFTGVEFSIPISGTGANASVSLDSPSSIDIQDQSYDGAAPPDNSQLISVGPAEAVPEPSPIGLVALALLGIPACRRFTRVIR